MITLLEAPAKCTRCGKDLSPGDRARVYGARVYGECCHTVPLDVNLWQEALKVAKRFRWKADPEDRDVLVQDIVLKCAEVARRKELTEASLWVIARYVVFHYWRERGKKPHSLNSLVPNTEEPIELWETLEDKDTDLDAWLEARFRLGELPTGVLRIARKLEMGNPLTQGQRARLARFRQDGDSNPSSAWSRKRYRKLKARGLCPTCGKERSGSVRCPECREKARRGQARYRRRKGRAWQRTLRAYWRKQGRCPRCGKPPEPGRKTCSRCLAKNRECLRQWRLQNHTGPARPKHLLYPPQHLLDPFADIIKDMMEKGWEPHRMLEGLRAQGYRGHLCTLYVYLQRLKGAVPCPWCGCPFTPSKAHTKYCSPECQRKRVRRAHAAYLARRYHQDPAFRAKKLERGRRQRARRRALAET